MYDRRQKYRRSRKGRAAEARYRASRPGKDARNRRDRRARERLALARPFVGVDGEGAGTDAVGRQDYSLLRAGDEELWEGGRRLTSEECLGFLADLPAGPTYVAYFVGYDATMWLRDLPEERLRRVLADRPRDRFQNTVEWRDFEVEYLRRKHFRVRRRGGRWVTVSDASAFFQCAFVKALELWEVGTAAERALVQAGKERRGGERLAAADRRYCALEVRLLAELMDKFRAACAEAGYRPARYEGPGYLASAMMRAHRVPKREASELPVGLRRAAEAAYYGGRFELLHYGEVGRCHEYDLNSAYPRALLDLPCLVHGRWRRVRDRDLRRVPVGRESVCHVSFFKVDRHVCDLPVRTPERRIVWPREGSGWYWGVELAAALRAGTRFEVDDAWRYERRCDCAPFSFVPEAYEERRRLGKDGRGLVLKLGLNSLYGKTAQSVGAAPYASPVWAGLVTATTRAAIVDAYRRVPAEEVVMVATDGLYTRVPVPGLDLGDGLGQWSHRELSDLLTVQPGCYFHGGTVKSRGVPRSAFGPHREAFRRAFRAAVRGRRGGRGDLGSVRVPLTMFVGLTLALHRGDQTLAGRWVAQEKEVRFDLSQKRRGWRREGGRAVTFTQPGGAESVPYDRHFGHTWESEEHAFRVAQDEQPDYLPLLPE